MIDRSMGMLARRRYSSFLDAARRKDPEDALADPGQMFGSVDSHQNFQSVATRSKSCQTQGTGLSERAYL
jgi:hypothetical protein